MEDDHPRKRRLAMVWRPGKHRLVWKCGIPILIDVAFFVALINGHLARTKTDPCINQNDLDNFIYKEKNTKSLEFLHPSIALLGSERVEAIWTSVWWVNHSKPEPPARAWSSQFCCFASNNLRKHLKPIGLNPKWHAKRLHKSPSMQKFQQFQGFCAFWSFATWELAGLVAWLQHFGRSMTQHISHAYQIFL